jgi:hypothetical protein
MLLLRHPAAVADSFRRLNWLQDLTLEMFGYLYGTRMHQAVEAVRKADSKIIFYEQIANNPHAGFSEIFSFMGVSVPQNFERALSRYCHSEGDSYSFETRRVTARQINKWKSNLRQRDIDEIRRGYFRSPLPYYREETQWKVD